MSIEYRKMPIGYSDGEAGVYYAYDSDCTDWVSNELRQGRVFALNHFIQMNKLCPTGRILDVGAHVGTFSLAAGLSDHYEVIAVEASAKNAAVYQAAIDKNGFTNIKLYNTLISDREEELEFLDNGRDSARVADDTVHMGDRSEIVRLDARTLGSILEENGWDKVDYMKIDVEGYEIKAFEGMKKYLALDDSPIILFEVNGHTLSFYNETPNNMMRVLEKCGYSCLLLENLNLVPISSFEPIPVCVDDFLAMKPKHLHLFQAAGLVIGQPYTYQERLDKISGQVSRSVPACLGYWLDFISRNRFFLEERQIRAAFKASITNPANKDLKESVENFLQT